MKKKFPNKFEFNLTDPETFIWHHWFNLEQHPLAPQRSKNIPPHKGLKNEDIIAYLCILKNSEEQVF